jgi:hypothetical protein
MQIALSVHVLSRIKIKRQARCVIVSKKPQILNLLKQISVWQQSFSKNPIWRRKPVSQMTRGKSSFGAATHPLSFMQRRFVADC